MFRLFSLEEAEALLPEVTPRLQQLRELRCEFERASLKLRELHRKARGNGHMQRPEEFFKLEAACDDLRQRMGERIQQLLDLGIQLKDMEVGLIDFPSLREGRTVYLCWKLGEAGIRFWHEPEAGFAGRQPL